MKLEDAVKINELVEKMISLANEVLYITNNQSNEERREQTKRALAYAITELDLEILQRPHRGQDARAGARVDQI